MLDKVGIQRKGPTQESPSQVVRKLPSSQDIQILSHLSLTEIRNLGKKKDVVSGKSNL